jgi:RimJ/RimL family protein N-acetyltransferase
MTATTCDPSTLADETVELRPMQADDEERLVGFHATLSRETTYLRYFTQHPTLRPEEVHRFTHVDHSEREAFVATVAGEITGVGRFDRLDDRTSAEVAFVVSDAWQGRGIGRMLFDRLAARATELGIATLVAETLWSNKRMIGLFHSVGRAVTTHAEGGVVHFDITLEPAGVKAEA